MGSKVSGLSRVHCSITVNQLSLVTTLFRVLMTNKFFSQKFNFATETQFVLV